MEHLCVAFAANLSRSEWPMSDDKWAALKQRELRNEATGCRILARLVETGEQAAEVPISKPAPDIDGPVPPDAFLFKGKRFAGLARQPFLALQYVWPLPGRAATKKDLAGPVFGDCEELVEIGQIHNIRRDLNSFFRLHSLPFMATVINDYLAMKQTRQ